MNTNPTEEKKYILTLPESHLRMVLGGLGKLPAEASFDTIVLVQQQAAEQDMPKDSEVINPKEIDLEADQEGKG